MKNILASRTFWAALLTILVVIVSSVIPGFALDAEHAGGLAAVAVGYLVAYAISPTAPGLAALLTSRKFWTAGLGFIVLILDAFKFFPRPLDVASLVGFVTLISAYMVMIAVDPGAGWRGLLVSRKFWAAVVGLVFVFLRSFGVDIPLTPDQIVAIIVVITGFIAGAGIQGPPAELPEPEISDSGQEK